MNEPLLWACRCGSLQARILPGSSSRCMCYCNDCQAFARHLGQSSMLDAHGGSDILQTTPDRIEVMAGREHLACLRLTEKGPLRWFAGCCNSPMANSGGSINMPFASVLLAFADDPSKAGEIMARVNRRYATGRIAGEKGSLLRLVAGVIRRTAYARLSGRHRRTPFFSSNGQPVATPRLLDEGERRAAYGAERGS